jgi:hypothetical protein
MEYINKIFIIKNIIMNYLNLIIEDTLIVIISKIKSRDGIISFQNSDISINQLLTKTNSWKLLINLNYPNVYNLLNKEYTVHILKLIYELCLLDKSFGISYIKYLNIDFISLGYRNKIFITVDIIYSAYYKIRYHEELYNSKISRYSFIYHMNYSDSINLILESFIGNYLLEINEIGINFGSLTLLIQAYQLNYDVYLKLVYFYKNNLTKTVLDNIINIEENVRKIIYNKKSCPNIYTDPFYISKDKQLVISDLKNRWNA